MPRASAALLVPAIAAAAASSTRAELPEACDVAVVGAGWAGVYFAWRTAESSPSSKVCLFEASHRVGGRTYSVHLQESAESFTLDVGAYRFSPDMHLPGDVILKALKLPTACYEPDCEPANKDFPPPFHFNYSAPLRRIVDAEGMPAGYATALDALIDRFKKAGGSLFMGARLTDLQPAASGSSHRLMFGDRHVAARRVMLNLPREALLNLPKLKAATPDRTVSMQQCVRFDLPQAMFPPGHSLSLGRSLTKAYAFYEDAWWHTVLNRTSGQLPDNAFLPVNTSFGIPIGIHFNDGPVRCESPGVKCRGFLEVYYSTAKEDFFEDLRADPQHPLAEVSASTPAGAAKLRTLHAAVMEATKPLFAAAGKPQPSSAPVQLVVGVWGRGGGSVGYTAPTKVYYSTSETVPGGPDPLERACGVSGLTESEYRDSVMAPLGKTDLSLLVANNDWVAQRTEELFGDWAEESLLQAERGLCALGVERPAWLDEAYYDEKVVRVAGSTFSACSHARGPADTLVV